MKSKKLLSVGIIAAIIIACTALVRYYLLKQEQSQPDDIIGGADGPTSIFVANKVNKDGYTSITMETAEMLLSAMDPSWYILLDVRRADEYAEGHIPGAINIANEEIGSDRPEELPDLNQNIFVYCRSGRRSKEASKKLADMGYTRIYEFGGIIDWTGDIEK